MVNNTRTSETTDFDAWIERDVWLDKVLQATNARYFRGQAKSRIGWGLPVSPVIMDRTPDGLPQAPAACWREHEVLIHPALRDFKAPRYVIVYLIYHELLHELHPGPPGKDPHTAALLLLEQERIAPARERAHAWLRKREFPVLRLPSDAPA